MNNPESLNALTERVAKIIVKKIGYTWREIQDGRVPNKQDFLNAAKAAIQEVRK